MGGHLALSALLPVQSLDCTPTLSPQRYTVLFIVEYFSKFIILCVLEHLDSLQVVKVLLYHVVCTFEKPLQVKMDVGKEFAGKFA